MKTSGSRVGFVVKVAGVVAVAILITAALTGARKGKPLSGLLKDGVFTDTANGFSVPVSDDWKAKLGSAESDVRLTVVHENPPLERPKGRPNRSNMRNIWAFSKVRFIVVSSDLSSANIVDSMISDASSWKLREDIWKDLTPTVSGGWRVSRVSHRSRRPVTVAGKKATQWRGKLCYTPIGSEAEMEMGLFLTAVDCEDHVLLVAASCEESIMDWLSGETTKLLDSMKVLP